MSLEGFAVIGDERLDFGDVEGFALLRLWGLPDEAVLVGWLLTPLSRVADLSIAPKVIVQLSMERAVSRCRESEERERAYRH